jgi:hypothetical protein
MCVYYFTNYGFQTIEITVASLLGLQYCSKFLLWLWVKLSMKNMFTEPSNSDFNECVFISLKQEHIIWNWGVTYRNNTVHDSRFRLQNSLLSYLEGTL